MEYPVQRILEQLSACLNVLVGKFCHVPPQREKRHCIPQDPIYQYAFKYSLSTAAQMQPCYTFVEGKRPWLSFSGQQSGFTELNSNQPLQQPRFWLIPI